VNNINLYPVSHHFWVIVACWSSYCYWQGCLYLTTPSFGLNHWTLVCRMWPQVSRNITLSCVTQNISIYWTV